MHTSGKASRLVHIATVPVLASFETTSTLAATTDHAVSNARAHVSLTTELKDALHNPTSPAVSRTRATVIQEALRLYPGATRRRDAVRIPSRALPRSCLEDPHLPKHLFTFAKGTWLASEQILRAKSCRASPPVSLGRASPPRAGFTDVGAV